MNRNNKVTIGFFILLALTAVYDISVRGGEKLWRIGLLYITISLAWVIFSKSFFRKSKSAYLVTLVFIFFSMYLANVFDFYAFEPYDKILHFSSGILLAFYGLVFCAHLTNGVSTLKGRNMIFIVFSLLFGIAAAGVWEIWEFTTDSLFGLTAQNGSLVDTMWDIICGTIASLISCAYMYVHFYIKKSKLIDSLIKDMAE